MTKEAVLITGANGEIGHGLIEHLVAEGRYRILALDLDDSHLQGIKDKIEFIRGDVRDQKLMDEIGEKYVLSKIFHLAALLSSRGEKDPILAHQVNVEGSLNLLNLAKRVSDIKKRSVVFVFPSTIAAYGIRSPEIKRQAGKVSEDQFLEPITMYGTNKLSIEHLGRYFADFYSLLHETPETVRIDFRCVRLPGVLSASSVPSGGTSDYGPEMLHAAAQGKPYACFVTPETILPFMTMPDAVQALIKISDAPREKLSRKVYNVTSFSVSAAELEAQVKKYFPDAQISYKPHQKRHMIVESWPAAVDDGPARRDFGFSPAYDFNRAFSDYLVPGVIARYGHDLSQKKTING